MSALFSLHNPPTTTLFRHRSLIKNFEKSTKLKIDVLGFGNFRQLLGKPLVQPEVINGSIINFGNKINPLNFRPGATQSHHSVWFSQPKNYSQGLEEDKIIRDFIEKYAEKKRRLYSSKNKFVGGIARIFIQKRIDLTEIIIYMGPKLFIGNRPGEIEELQGYLQKELNCVPRKVKIAITKTAKTYGNANILAEWLSIKIKDGVSCPKAMKKAIELAEQEDIKGIQVQIKGRIDGKEIASVEWFREGRVPLQTIRAKIDYCAHKVQTKSGVLGIKIWILTDEE